MSPQNKGRPSDWMEEEEKIRCEVILKEFVDQNANIFLDELTIAFRIKIGNCFIYSTICRYVTKELNYCLMVLTRIAKERCVQTVI